MKKKIKFKAEIKPKDFRLSLFPPNNPSTVYIKLFSEEALFTSSPVLFLD